MWFWGNRLLYQTHECEFCIAALWFTGTCIAHVGNFLAATMPLSNFTMNAILSEWKAPIYDGKCLAQIWLTKIEQGCNTYGIPTSQRIGVAIYYMSEEPQAVFQDILDRKIRNHYGWTWDEFQQDLIAIDSKCCTSIVYLRF